MTTTPRRSVRVAAIEDARKTPNSSTSVVDYPFVARSTPRSPPPREKNDQTTFEEASMEHTPITSTYPPTYGNTERFDVEGADYGRRRGYSVKMPETWVPQFPTTLEPGTVNLNHQNFTHPPPPLPLPEAQALQEELNRQKLELQRLTLTNTKSLQMVDDLILKLEEPQPQL